jgi:hypothetical protein
MDGWDDDNMDLSAYPKRTSTDPSSPEYIGFNASVPGELHGKDIMYYLIPRGLKIYHGNNAGRATKKRTDRIKWFGFNPVELQSYGKIFEYEVASNLRFIDMGSAITLGTLYELAKEEGNERVQRFLMSEYGYNPETNQVGFRHSDHKQDMEVAQFLQKQFTGTDYKGYALVGAKMQSEFGGEERPFHPEICFVTDTDDAAEYVAELKEDKRKIQQKIPEIGEKKRVEPSSPTYGIHSPNNANTTLRFGSPDSETTVHYPTANREPGSGTPRAALRFDSPGSESSPNAALRFDSPGSGTPRAALRFDSPVRGGTRRNRKRRRSKHKKRVSSQRIRKQTRKR